MTKKSGGGPSFIETMGYLKAANDTTAGRNTEQTVSQLEVSFRGYISVVIFFYFIFYTICNVFDINILYRPEYPNSRDIQTSTDFYNSIKDFLRANYPNLPDLPNKELKKPNDGLYVNYFQPNVETQKFFYYIMLVAFLFFFCGYSTNSALRSMWKSITFWIGAVVGIALVCVYYTMYPNGSATYVGTKKGFFEYTAPIWIWSLAISLPLFIVLTQIGLGAPNKVQYILYVALVCFCFFSLVVFAKYPTLVDNVMYAPKYFITLPAFLFFCLLLWCYPLKGVPQLNMIEQVLFAIIFVGFLTAYFMRGMQIFTVPEKKPCMNPITCLEEQKQTSTFQNVLQSMYFILLVILILFAFTMVKN
jgi:hypothetical protein